MVYIIHVIATQRLDPDGFVLTVFCKIYFIVILKVNLNQVFFIYTLFVNFHTLYGHRQAFGEVMQIDLTENLTIVTEHKFR